ncbi:MAG TPA: CDF family Co(II)/Ni(II) efflux transporter DmeF [Rhizomicrobium sp.]|jgi:cation diffusion facilitator family transporter|nr:CDF family Co(II)/Ni(II) efflux transporter DmeF [Rhizomicrobium sp.]
MAIHDHSAHEHGIWTHDHVFLGAGHRRAESRARLATMITVVFMAVEIAAGVSFRSMALVADGFHMATHVGALGLAAGAYWLARRHAKDTRFTFGSGKFGDLAAFASAIILGVIAAGVAFESATRLLNPVAVNYRDALVIAAFGVVVNLVSAVILHEGHDHSHGHAHAHDDHDHARHDHGPEGHADNNMRAAYIHVLADAATSVLAVGALAAGLIWGVVFLDPLVGVIGAGVIASWAYGLIRDSALVLLDAEDNPALATRIRAHLETAANTRVCDLHLWRLGPGHRGLVVSLVSPAMTDAEAIKSGLRRHFPDLSHVTVEVAVCADCGQP